MRRGFTLIEMLVVIAIIAIVAGIAFPAFARAKAAAKQTSCISNLAQIGKAMLLYMSDYDDLFPHATDTVDRYHPEIWASQIQWQAQIPYMPLMHEVLQPYVKNKDVFHCPADSGSFVVDNQWNLTFQSSPSMFATFGSSYFYRTEITFRGLSQTSLSSPAAINVLFDAAGHWHSGERALRLNEPPMAMIETLEKYRYTVLHGDMHVKSLTYGAQQQAWRTPLE
jgi:general secretion pathway protein G